MSSMYCYNIRYEASLVTQLGFLIKLYIAQSSKLFNDLNKSTFIIKIVFNKKKYYFFRDNI